MDEPQTQEIFVAGFGCRNPATADADYRNYYLNLSLKSTFSGTNIIHELLVDSRAWFDTIATLHPPPPFLLRKTVTRLLDGSKLGW